jgi:hypothetical protein
VFPGLFGRLEKWLFVNSWVKNPATEIANTSICYAFLGVFV